MNKSSLKDTLLCLGLSFVNAQDTPKPAKTQTELTKTSKLTTESVTYKGNTYKVYPGPRGGFFIIIINTKCIPTKHYLKK